MWLMDITRYDDMVPSLIFSQNSVLYLSFFLFVHTVTLKCLGLTCKVQGFFICHLCRDQQARHNRIIFAGLSKSTEVQKQTHYNNNNNNNNNRNNNRNIKKYFF